MTIGASLGARLLVELVEFELVLEGDRVHHVKGTW